MKYQLIIMLSVIFLLSCSKPKEEKSLLHTFHKQYECPLKLLDDYPIDSIGKADFMYFSNNHIILSDNSEDYLLSSYNLRSKKYSRFLRKGNGPGELLDIQQLGNFSDSSFFVKGTFDKKIHIYTTENDLIVKDSIMPIPPNSVSLFFADNLLITSRLESPRFSMTHLKERKEKIFGKDMIYENFDKEILTSTLQGFLVGSAKINKIAWFSFYGEAYELYDYSNIDEIVCIKQYFGELPFEENNSPMFNLDSKLGITSLTSNNEFIFALYNGKSIEEFMNTKDGAFFCNKLLVFNWEGTPICILNLSRDVRSISYNEELNVLYAIGCNEEFDYSIYYIDNIREILAN